MGKEISTQSEEETLIKATPMIKVLFAAFMIIMPIIFIKVGFGIIYKVTMGALFLAIIIQIYMHIKRGNKHHENY